MGKVDKLYIVNQFINQQDGDRYRVYTQVIEGGNVVFIYENCYPEATEEAASLRNFNEVLNKLEGPCQIILNTSRRKLLNVETLRPVMLRNKLSLYRPAYILGKFIFPDFPDKTYSTDELDDQGFNFDEILKLLSKAYKNSFKKQKGEKISAEA